MKMDSMIFDVDGTLWDATKIVAEAWTAIARREYDPQATITFGQLQQLFGKLLPDIAASLFPRESPERQMELIHICCEAEHQALLAAPKAPIFPGLEDTLKTLSKKYKLFIVSNCQAGYIEVFLKCTGFSPYFQGHLCPGDTGRPKGDNILEIIRRHHLESPVYIGDTEGDFLATRQAGIPFVHASYGYGRVDAPEYVISQISDLTRLF